MPHASEGDGVRQTKSSSVAFSKKLQPITTYDPAECWCRVKRIFESTQGTMYDLTGISETPIVEMLDHMDDPRDTNTEMTLIVVADDPTPGPRSAIRRALARALVPPGEP